MSAMHSTGRGGAGNIGKDDTVYTDGGIVREGPLGEPAAGSEYSTGRGGAGNIPHAHHNHHGGSAEAGTTTGPGTAGAATMARKDDEYVPETATREAAAEKNYHTGRGGGGNVHKDKYGGHSSEHEQKHAGESVTEKVKHLLHMDKKE